MHNILKLFQLDVYRYDVYKSPNIGLFAKTNDTLIIVPFGYAETKTNKLIEFLKVEGRAKYICCRNTAHWSYDSNE